MNALKEAPKSMLKFEGTPHEIGAQIWQRMCNPAIHAATARPEKERMQLYAGILMAAFGSMAADFGHDKATEIVCTLGDVFAAMGDELQGSQVQ